MQHVKANLLPKKVASMQVNCSCDYILQTLAVLQCVQMEHIFWKNEFVLVEMQF